MQNSKKTISPGREYIVSFTNNLIHTLNTKFPGIKSMGSLLCLLIFFSLASCSLLKNPVYFKNLPNDTTLNNVVTQKYELKIQKNDVLGITVASLSPDVAFYNAPQNTVGPVNGYQVDENGNISFVKLGILHVEGMTRKELKDTLEKNLVPYLRDVVVSVGFLNRHITMLGGLNPQIIPMPGDNMTILDALAASGDIGVKGRIDNVLVIRDTGSAKTFKRLNLENSSIFSSSYYYLQPNDIVYVEPLKERTPLTAAQIISYVISTVSLIVLITRL